LDLVITANTSSLSPVIDYSPVSPSDHFPILSALTIAPVLGLGSTLYSVYHSPQLSHLRLYSMPRRGEKTQKPTVSNKKSHSNDLSENLINHRGTREITTAKLAPGIHERFFLRDASK